MATARNKQVTGHRTGPTSLTHTASTAFRHLPEGCRKPVLGVWTGPALPHTHTASTAFRHLPEGCRKPVLGVWTGPILPHFVFRRPSSNSAVIDYASYLRASVHRCCQRPPKGRLGTNHTTSLAFQQRSFKLCHHWLRRFTSAQLSADSAPRKVWVIRR